MIIFSINFGHDASFAIFKDGVLIDFVEIERESRLKHHLGITIEYLNEYLSRIKLNIDSIDFICCSGTQYWGAYTSSEIKIKYGYTDKHKKFLPNSDLYDLSNFDFSEISGGGKFNYHIEKQKIISNPSPTRKKWALINPILNLQSSTEDIKKVISIYEDSSSINCKLVQENFFCPLIISLDGRDIPGLYIDHHAAHANYASYYSNSNAIIVTHDGGLAGRPYNSGGIYINYTNKPVFPLYNHKLALGHIYDSVANYIGIDAGKLMGLSSYGKPNRHINEIVVNYISSLYYDQPINPQFIVGQILQSSAIDHVLREELINKFKFELKNLDLQRAIQAASNTQYFVQKVYSKIISEFSEKINEVDSSFKNVYTTGGFSLNCPTNTEINNSSTTLFYKPLPAVGDTGISIGSAVAFMNYLLIKINKPKDDNKLVAAFPPSLKKYNIHLKNENRIIKLYEMSEETTRILSNELIMGKIICTFLGRSEVGPRALGHRSIIAWAGDEFNRDRINKFKGRENWRPLAPIILKDDFNTYFTGDPDESIYMLNVSKVKSDKLPAVTHVDNTARVQVLDKSELILSKILEYLKINKHVPVIINTSFNCAGEPLVETFENAVNSFITMEFDYLITENSVYIKK